MYSIFAGNTCIYDDSYVSDEFKLIDPVLTMEDNSAGSLEITLPPDNIGYSLVKRMTTEIIVKKDNAEIWSGRVLSESTDFLNRRTLYCEGELAYLNDTTQPQAEYHAVTVRQFLEQLISKHNSRADEDNRIDKHFTVGIVTVTDSNDSLYRYTNYEKTMECINEKLIKRLGGHLRIRKSAGIRYLDYLADYPNTNSQVINFGENLLDFTKSYDMSELATVIIPLGKALDSDTSQSSSDSNEILTKYLTVMDINHEIYVRSQAAIERFGWIEKVVHWDDVTLASNLLSKAERYLSDIQFEEMLLEVSAMDLSYIDVEYEYIKLLDEIQVVSVPHGLKRLFPVTKITIPLDSPEKAKFELGTNVRQSLTEVNNKTNYELLNRIENIPEPSSILKSAQDNATQLITNATNGYVTILSDDGKTQEILITNLPDYTEATKIWRWNINGLGYSSTGYEGQYNLAMTMDGAIVADRITTGTMSADRIRGGTLLTISSSDYWIKLVDGDIIGGHGSEEYGRINTTASIYNESTGNTDHGFLIRTNTLCIRAGDIATRSGGSNEALLIGGTGDLTFVSNVYFSGSDLNVEYTTVHFENGIMTSRI